MGGHSHVVIAVVSTPIHIRVHQSVPVVSGFDHPNRYGRHRKAAEVLRIICAKHHHRHQRENKVDEEDHEQNPIDLSKRHDQRFRNLGLNKED